MPSDTEEKRQSKYDDYKSEYLVNLNIHERFQNWIGLIFVIFANSLLQSLVIVSVDVLLDPVDVQELEETRDSKKLKNLPQSTLLKV